MLDWEQFLTDLRGDDVDRALAACEQITARVMHSDLPQVYELARDDDYFVRVMAGDILARTAGIGALPTLLQIMLRNEEEGFENDGLDGVVRSVIDANPITARGVLEPLRRSSDARAQSLARWGMEGLPEETTVVTPLIIPTQPRGRRGCFLTIGAMALCITALLAWADVPPVASGDCTGGHYVVREMDADELTAWTDMVGLNKTFRFTAPYGRMADVEPGQSLAPFGSGHASSQ